MYSNNKTIQILIKLLKEHGIRYVVASPGTTNIMFVASIENDPWFKIYSSVDERSAAYIACGLATETGETVVLSCTGATASRNYYPGLTEAFYRKLPILAITSLSNDTMPGNNMPQIVDRSLLPKDIVNSSVLLPDVQNRNDKWKCELLINKAIIALKRNGGGPSHIELETQFSRLYDCTLLPSVSVINYYSYGDSFPVIDIGKKVGIFVGDYRRDRWTEKFLKEVDKFCEKYNAVVLCDHSSNYTGKYRVVYPIIAAQENLNAAAWKFDIIIDIGGVSGNYYTFVANEVWRVDVDGELKDRFKNLKKVFGLKEEDFFSAYTRDYNSTECDNFLYEIYKKKEVELRNEVPELPYSNIWIAQQMISSIPADSSVYLGILNSLRSWNFFETTNPIITSANVGGFGIDGGLSTMVGASLSNPEKKFFCVIGDLAFFYDMNCLGNRHINNNIRILLINNGKGTEFRHYSHPAFDFGDEADKYIAAGGHFGNKSKSLVKGFAESLGFEYMCADSKETFLEAMDVFVSSNLADKPIILEAFTDSDNENVALKLIRNIESNVNLKSTIKEKIGEKNIERIRKIIGK